VEAEECSICAWWWLWCRNVYNSCDNISTYM